MPRSKREVVTSQLYGDDAPNIIVTEYPWRVPAAMIAREESLTEQTGETGVVNGRTIAMNRRPEP